MVVAVLDVPRPPAPVGNVPAAGAQAYRKRRGPVDAQAFDGLCRPLCPATHEEEVAPDLPDKIVDIVRVDLGKEHRHIYDQYLARERARILDLLRVWMRTG